MEDMKRTLLSVLLLIMYTVVWSQSLTIQGNVTGKNDGYPVIGATVVETNQPTNGTCLLYTSDAADEPRHV